MIASGLTQSPIGQQQHLQSRTEKRSKSAESIKKYQSIETLNQSTLSGITPCVRFYLHKA